MISIFCSYFRPVDSLRVHRKVYDVTVEKRKKNELIVTCQGVNDIVSFTFIFTEDEQKITNIILSRINAFTFHNNNHIHIYSLGGKTLQATIRYDIFTKTFTINENSVVTKVVNS